MDSPPLRKNTTATVEAIPYFGLEGESVAIVVIKDAFYADSSGEVSRVGGAEVRYIDDPWDPDEPEGSPKYPSDISLAKPSTDVIVAGSAMARHRAPVTELDVIVRVGPVQKALKVFGQRSWQKGLMGLSMTAPEPFEEVPLRWELAFGGSDFSEGERPLEEARNPLGRGIARSPATLAEQPLAQIEDPRELIRNPRSHPAPAGVAPLMRHWEPRRRYTGTIDEQWMEERMPLLPLDFDPRFNQVATPELITPRPLSGGEVVQVNNMNADAPIECELPTIRFYVGSATSRHGVREHRPMLDTVLLEPSERRIELTWRSIVPLPRRSRELEYIQVFEKNIGGLP